MRKFLIPLLMASAVMPATANADPGDRGRSHSERSERSDGNDDRSSNKSHQRTERSNDNVQRTQRVERSNDAAPRVNVDRSARVERNVNVQTAQPVQVQRIQRQQVADQNQRVRRDRRDGSFLGVVQQAGRDENARQRGETVARRNNDGDRRWNGGDRDHHRWSGDWRRDNRYDWRTYRNRYSSLFRLGRYYDPYGWNYRRFSIGFTLGSSYYGSNNWLNDPWQYRLPPAYGPYRWVRYYDDALLVNIYTGQVVDVIYSFFW